MATSKHFRQERPSDADLKGNPGIGTSSGRQGHVIRGDIQGETQKKEMCSTTHCLPVASIPTSAAVRTRESEN